MTDSEKLDVLLDAVNELTTVVQEVQEQQAEILEKLSNITLPGLGYSVFDE